MSDSVPLVYFRGQFEILGKKEELVIVIHPDSRKIIFCDYADNAMTVAQQMEKAYLEATDPKEDRPI